jgi:hypothetical protein
MAGRRKEFQEHANGTIAIMRTLSQNSLRNPTAFAVFWPFVRDKIITAAEFHTSLASLSPVEDGDPLQELETSVYRSSLSTTLPLSKQFHEILGLKTVKQLRDIEHELPEASFHGSTWLEILRQTTALSILRLSTTIYILRPPPYVWDQLTRQQFTSYTETVWVDFLAELKLFEQESLVEEVKSYQLAIQSTADVDARKRILTKLVNYYQALMIHQMRRWIVRLLESLIVADVDSGLRTEGIVEDSTGQLACQLGDFIQANIESVQDNGIGINPVIFG